MEKGGLMLGVSKVVAEGISTSLCWLEEFG